MHLSATVLAIRVLFYTVFDLKTVSRAFCHICGIDKGDNGISDGDDYGSGWQWSGREQLQRHIHHFVGTSCHRNLSSIDSRAEYMIVKALLQAMPKEYL